MQTVSAAFTAEEKDSVRRIAHNLQVSWKKFSTLSNRTFTIGVSTIGGSDIIGINPGAVGSPGNYKYFDESDYVTALAWERGLNMPVGGLSKALAEAHLDNTSGRFTPRYMGGNSELFTSAHLPRRPMIINAGFEIGGVDITIPQFSGVTIKPTKSDTRNREVLLQAADYVDFFGTKYVDTAAMFTARRTDVIIESLLTQLGMSTAQYSLDAGLNIIPFGMYESGDKFSDIIDELVEAEAGHFYQDESGIFRFENRQHWDSAPYTQVQRVILTGQVIGAESPNTDHIINVVEVKTNPRVKQSGATLYTLSGTIALPVGDTEVFVDFENPVLAANAPSFTANSASDGSGTNLTSSVSIRSTSVFARAAKYIFTNSSSQAGFLTSLSVTGRWAVLRYDEPQYLRVQDDSSVTAYEEKNLVIDNPWIQDLDTGRSIAQLILNDFSSPENIQKVTIRAIPELQLGDLISWQGRYWRIFDIKSTLNPSVGFIQELTMVQRVLQTYFRIGISTIGSSDKIAP